MSTTPYRRPHRDVWTRGILGFKPPQPRKAPMATKLPTYPSPITLVNASDPKGGKGDLADAFRRSGGLGLVEETLAEAGYVPADGSRPAHQWRLTVLAQSERSTKYPQVSGVNRDTQPDGVRLRVRPDRRSDRLFILRLTSPSFAARPGAYDEVAAKLRAAAAEVFNPAGAAEPPPASPAHVDAAVAAVARLGGLSFASADRATWARSVADVSEVFAALGAGSAAAVAAAEAALARAEDEDRLTWSPTAGYASPVPVSALPEAPPVPPAPPVQPQPPAPATAPSGVSPAAADQLAAVLAELAGCQAAYAKAVERVKGEHALIARIEVMVREAEHKLAGLRTDLSEARAALAAAEQEKARAFVGVDSARVLRLATLIEQAEATAAAPPPAAVE